MVTVIAHRGASAYAPENTLAAIDEAARRGADMVELDVRLSADGELVVLHDPTLGRTSDARLRFPDRHPWNASDFTLAELRELDAGSWFDRRFAGEPIPTLRQALDRLRALELGVLLEVKASRGTAPSAEHLLAELAADPYWLAATPGRPRLILQSFCWDLVGTVKRRLPWVSTAVLGRAHGQRGLGQVSAYADLVNPHFLRVNAPYVRQVRGHGMRVFAWTVNRRRFIRKMIRDGVDGVISDYPDVVAAEFAAAGAAVR
ncbi:glycerophosphodiester phosphodiesterase [Allonocardiopsis opalescens]|uniref:Glycerophosphoryl diester phosphodiesterase n=1 Tax=Allonocardiopsis opalescens TaxID=1144618 RepID=A0A2T0QFA0_9ACTN|nr:glycerophosphodiester phosphodiesterase family protein [Allonocardiopsis opalescens]PRY02585.1 glycerophosphoryl diester phosphodiesterase [Allonocardiopsis opalescens]